MTAQEEDSKIIMAFRKAIVFLLVMTGSLLWLPAIADPESVDLTWNLMNLSGEYSIGFYNSATPSISDEKLTEINFENTEGSTIWEKSCFFVWETTGSEFNISLYASGPLESKGTQDTVNWRVSWKETDYSPAGSIGSTELQPIGATAFGYGTADNPEPLVEYSGAIGNSSFVEVNFRTADVSKNKPVQYTGELYVKVEGT